MDAVYGESAFACGDLVLSGFVRIVTHPRVFTNPDPLPDALEFTTAIRQASNCVPVTPGQRHYRPGTTPASPACVGGIRWTAEPQVDDDQRLMGRCGIRPLTGFERR
jgi:hypothetical protein